MNSDGRLPDQLVTFLSHAHSICINTPKCFKRPSGPPPHCLTHLHPTPFRFLCLCLFLFLGVGGGEALFAIANAKGKVASSLAFGLRNSIISFNLVHRRSHGRSLARELDTRGRPFLGTNEISWRDTRESEPDHRKTFLSRTYAHIHTPGVTHAYVHVHTYMWRTHVHININLLTNANKRYVNLHTYILIRTHITTPANLALERHIQHRM